jgi:hypothetical protein
MALRVIKARGLEAPRHLSGGDRLGEQIPESVSTEI